MRECRECGRTTPTDAARPVPPGKDAGRRSRLARVLDAGPLAVATVLYVATLLGVLALPAVAVAQTTLLVDADAPIGGDGSSWGNAYVDLRDAIDTATLDPTVDQIWVAAGTYHPGNAGQRSATFTLLDGVAILGGFAGSETSATARDPLANVTILSGDIDQNDTFGTPQWDDAGWSGYEGNSYHVVTGNGTGPTAVLDGFEVIGGSSAAGGIPVPFGNFGGGLFLQGASPTVRNCHFRRNTAADASGAAIFCQNGSPVIEACRFSENRVFGGQGGAMFYSGTGAATVRDCEFTANRSIGGSSAGGGGAIYLSQSVPGTIERCRFSKNISENFHAFGDPFGSFGGAIYNLAAGTTVRDCSFRENDAHAGGAIYSWGDLLAIINCEFFDHFVKSYEIDSGSAAGGGGGAIATQALVVTTTTIHQCTFASNTAGEGGGAMTYGQSALVVRNSIFHDNTATGEEVSIRQAQIKGDLDVAYCAIDGLFQPQQPGDPAPDPAQYPGSTEADPLFVDLACGDLRLTSLSPCLDAGDNSAVPAGITTDLRQAARFVDDAAPDVGVGPAPIIDMGAIEGSFAIPAAPQFVRGDANRNGAINLADAVTILTYLFSGGGAACLSSFDANDTGAVTIGDAVFLLSYLFQGSMPPVAPFPACGADPTPDPLPCDTCVPCV